MASWVNPIVSRLSSGDFCEDEFCGLILACSWPMPAAVLDQYAIFSAELKTALPSQAYVYPSSTLHCTVCSLRPFTAGPMNAETQDRLKAAWFPVLEAAKTKWGGEKFRLKMRKPTLEHTGVGVFRFDDVDGGVAALRAALMAAIEDAGGRAAVGGADRSLARPVLGAEEPILGDAGGAGPHVPDIVHTTLVRWAGEVEEEQAVFEAFRTVADGWDEIELEVDVVQAVLEDRPYMHLPTDGSRVWWTAELGAD